MTKQTRKYILYIFLLLAFSAVAVFFVVKDDAEKIFNSIITANPLYLIIGLELILLSLVINGLLLTFLTRIYNKSYKVGQGIANHMIGVFFSGITPSSSGGQFVQAYTFSKQNITITSAASILFMAFIVRQCVAILFSGITFPLRFNEIMNASESFNILGFDLKLVYISLIGFIVNGFVLLGMFFMAFSKKLHYVVVHGIINFLRKLHIFSKEKAEKKKKDIDVKVATFRAELKNLLTNWKILLITLFLAFLDTLVTSSYPFVMALAINAPIEHNLTGFIDSVCMSNFVGLISMMVPIPGAAGGAEIIFQLMFKTFVSSDISYVSSINLLWRTYSFYIPVLLGAFVFIFYRGSPKKEALVSDNSVMSIINVLSLTEEINIGLEAQRKFEEEHKIKRKVRKKYRPRLIEEQVSDLTPEYVDVEAHITELKKELQNNLTQNEQIVEQSEDTIDTEETL